jgi:hypothetical protein
MSAYSLLYSEMIRFGINKQCRFLHVGGGSTSSSNDKLLQYKLNFSDTTSDFYIGKKLHLKEIYEQVVGQWKEKYPEKESRYCNIFLKYRY